MVYKEDSTVYIFIVYIYLRLFMKYFVIGFPPPSVRRSFCQLLKHPLRIRFTLHNVRFSCELRFTNCELRRPVSRSCRGTYQLQLRNQLCWLPAASRRLPPPDSWLRYPDTILRWTLITSYVLLQHVPHLQRS